MGKNEPVDPLTAARADAVREAALVMRRRGARTFAEVLAMDLPDAEREIIVRAQVHLGGALDRRAGTRTPRYRSSR